MKSFSHRTFRLFLHAALLAGLLALWAGCKRDAAGHYDRPHDPWVFRSVLDSLPRSATAALHDNLYVAYHFSEDIWVDFKLFGLLGLTIVFIVLQGLYLSRYLKEETE